MSVSETTFEIILEKLKQANLNNRAKGYMFEKLSKHLLKEKDTANIYKNIYLWDEWDKKDGQDCGIDLVIQTNNDDYIAVQCKFLVSFNFFMIELKIVKKEKKQIIKFALLAGLAGIFVACGGSGSYVELKNDGYDQKLFDLANAEIKKKYPDYDLYHYTSIKAEKDIKNPDEKIKIMKFNIEKDKKSFEYNNYIFIKNKNTGDFKVLSTTCQSNFKKEIYCNSVDAPKYYLQ